MKRFCVRFVDGCLGAVMRRWSWKDVGVLAICGMRVKSCQ